MSLFSYVFYIFKYNLCFIHFILMCWLWEYFIVNIYYSNKIKNLQGVALIVKINCNGNSFMFLIIISKLPILCTSYLELKVKSKAESQGHTLHVIKISSFHYRVKEWYCTMYYQMQLKEGSYKLYTKKTAKCDLENYNKI